jgi:hypothetical protein
MSTSGFFLLKPPLYGDDDDDDDISRKLYPVLP